MLLFTSDYLYGTAVRILCNDPIPENHIFSKSFNKIAKKIVYIDSQIIHGTL